jgi:hypothetical protein
MKVTVLMPVFNRERFVDEAISSVLEQKYGDFELVLVDDGSTDATPSILARWQRDDSRVVVVTSPQNEGIPAALNRGLAVARGEYVARLDSDDVMMPGRLAAQAEVLDENAEVVLVSSIVELINVDGAHCGIWRGDEPHEVMQLLLNFFNFVGGGGQVMFRTAIAREEGGFPLQYPSSEDYALWTRLLRRGRIITLPVIGMKMRDHGERSLVRYAQVKRANWRGIMSESLQHYLGRIIEADEIDALIALWRLDGTRDSAARADAVMREAFAVFCRSRVRPPSRKLAAMRIAGQWQAAARFLDRKGDEKAAEAHRQFAQAWSEEAITERASEARIVPPLLANPTPLSASDVVVGCVTENTPKYLAQTTRLLQSIRWFGGEMAQCRIVVCAVETISPRAKRRFEELGAAVRIVPRFDARDGSSNRLQMLREVLDGPERVVLSLDSDILICGNVLPFLRDDAFQAKVAPVATVRHETFLRLFDHFNLPLPPRTFVTGYTDQPTIPYFNGGVIALPRALAATLLPEWHRHTAALLADPGILGDDVGHLHQAALTLALTTSGVAVRELPAELNFQLNMPHLPTPARYLAADPLVVHYHELADDAGSVHSTTFPGAQLQIERFNQKLGEERWRGLHRPRLCADAAADPTASGTARIAVVGMHRSGTSVTGQLLHAMGCHAGRSEKLPPADRFNPTGYWEHQDVVSLNDAVLDSLGASWIDPVRTDLAALPDDQYDAYVARARRIVGEMDAHGTWMIKDPRLALLFPIWHEAMEEPLVVMPWRHPAAVAWSLRDRDGIPLAVGVAMWEEYTRLMLASTIGARRVALAYEALIAEPEATVKQLYDQLTAAGATRLTAPAAADIRAIVDRELARSARAGIALTSEQAILLNAVESGEALEWNDVPRSSDSTRDLLRQYVNEERERLEHRREIEELEEKLAAMQRDMAHERQQHAAIVSGIRLDYIALEERALYERKVLSERAVNGAARDALVEGNRKVTEERDVLAETIRQEREAFSTLLELRERERRERDELKLTVAAVFASRSWKIGHAIARMWRRLIPSGIESAEERWRRQSEE